MEQINQESNQVSSGAELKRKSIHRKLFKLMDDLEDMCYHEIYRTGKPYAVSCNMDQANEIYVERMCKALYEIEDKFDSNTPPDVEDIKQYYFDELSHAMDTYKCRHVLCLDPNTGERYCGPCTNDTCKPSYLSMSIIMKDHIKRILDRL